MTHKESAALKARILADYKRGHKVSAIADKHGVQATYVSRIANKAGLRRWTAREGTP